MACDHDKCYSNGILCSNPPKMLWVCRKCGESGCDVGKYVDGTNSEYERLIKEKPVNETVNRINENHEKGTPEDIARRVADILLPRLIPTQESRHANVEAARTALSKLLKEYEVAISVLVNGKPVPAELVQIDIVPTR